VLKEYLLRGLVRDQRIGKLEKRMTAAVRSIDTIIYTLMPALPENRETIGFWARLRGMRCRFMCRLNLARMKGIGLSLRERKWKTPRVNYSRSCWR